MKPILIAAAAVMLGGCEINFEHAGADLHDTQSVDLDKAEMVRVEIKMGAGELQVDGGSDKLMDADFTYNIPSWKPQVTYNSSGFRGTLLIDQPPHSHGGSNMHYRWDVRLNDKVPMDINTDLGAGQARMDLGSLDLRSVQVHMGVGEMRLDLRGEPRRDYDVEIHGGVGQATVYLPGSVGVIATAKGGIGNITVNGLERRGDEWINPAHEHAPVTIHLDVHGGIGEIRLVAQ